jgi:crotonobetainyl-CoA:carnitine CoA-transferase CaiB-like acyl-CoA transferase
MRTDQPVNNHDDLLSVVDRLLEDELGLKRADTGGKVTFAGLDPLRPTVLKTGAASAAAAAVGSIASAILHRQRGGKGQDIHIDLRKAYTYQSPWQDVLYDCTKINGHSIMVLTSNFGGAINLPTRDNRFVMLVAPYPSQQAKVGKLLRCGMVPENLMQATRKWDALDLEAAGQEIQLPITMVRTQEEYRASEQYRAHASAPLIQIEKIGESAPEPLPPGPRPLSGVRALGMTHVVAGPTVLRQLAAAGADCLNLNQPGWFEDRMIYVQSDTGMRQAIVDAKNRKAVHALAKDADIFVENLKPHEAAQQGYGAEELAAVRPGIIYVRIKFNNVTGPWGDWVGFDFNAGASPTSRATSLARKDKGHAQLETPVRHALGLFRVVAQQAPELDRRTADNEQLIDAHLQRHRGLIAVPVVGTFGADEVGGACRRGVGQRDLAEGLVDALAVVRRIEAPVVDAEQQEGPRSAQPHRDRGRPQAPLLGAKEIVGRGRVQHCRPDTPYEPAFGGPRRREPQALHDVAHATFRTGEHVVDMRERNDRARDQIPIFVQREGQHRLRHKRVAEALVVAPAAVVEVVLDRYRDQVGQRVVQLLRQLILRHAVLFRLVLRWLIRLRLGGGRCSESGHRAGCCKAPQGQ